MTDESTPRSDAGDDEALSEELAAAYSADPRYDAIDVPAGWASLRPRLAPRRRSRRWLVFASGMAAGIALAGLVAVMLRTKPTVPSAETSVAKPSVAATASSPARAEYLRAVDDLTAAVRAGRQRLRPETVAAIDRSLATIDRAIREAEAAVAADPANAYAVSWLDTMLRRKLRVLQQAVSDINAVS
jgi:hypothetical protein